MAKDEEEFTPNPDQPVHQGKWTPEEEAYVEGLIEEFKAGLLPLAEGTSLRTFLSKMLNCQPMRISKKFVGSNYNGKQVYVRRKNTLSNEEVRSRRTKLQELERKFLAKASPMSAMNSTDNVNKATSSGNDGVGSSSNLAATARAAAPAQTSAAANLLGAVPGGLDAAALLAGRSNSKAAAAGRALLLGGSATALKNAGSAASASGSNLAGFSNAELAAELEKRAKSELQSRTSVENFLGSAAQLQARASVDALLANPFQSCGSRNNLFSAAASGSRTNLLNAAASGSRSNLLNAARSSFHRGSSASNLLNAALQKNSTSNLLNAARNSFHKNSTSNLLNAARSSFHRKSSASNLLNAATTLGAARNPSASLLNATASSFKKNSTSNLLNAMASARKNSASNLLNAARAADASSAVAGLGLHSLLQQREGQGGAGGSTEGRHSAASLTDFLERRNSMDFQSRVSSLMEGAAAAKNWSATGGSAKLSAGSGSRTDLANLRLSMQGEAGSGGGGGSSVFDNASAFAAAAAAEKSSSSNSKMDLAKLLNEQGIGAAAAAAAAGSKAANESLSAEMIEKEALMQQLRNAGFDSGSSPIGEYLLKQQLAGVAAGQGGGDGAGAASASAAESADAAELRHMLELKRKFLSQDTAGLDAERAAKRLR